MFDEPSSYLDVKQRLKAAVAIRDLLASDKFVIVVEHDLAVLDYLSDFVCCLYGRPGAYGVVTMPFSVREGSNSFFTIKYMRIDMCSFRSHLFRNQHFSRWIRPDGKLAISRNVAQFQNCRVSVGRGDQARVSLRLPDHDQTTRFDLHLSLFLLLFILTFKKFVLVLRL